MNPPDDGHGCHDCKHAAHTRYCAGCARFPPSRMTDEWEQATDEQMAGRREMRERRRRMEEGLPL